MPAQRPSTYQGDDTDHQRDEGGELSANGDLPSSRPVRAVVVRLIRFFEIAVFGHAPPAGCSDGHHDTPPRLAPMAANRRACRAYSDGPTRSKRSDGGPGAPGSAAQGVGLELELGQLVAEFGAALDHAISARLACSGDVPARARVASMRRCSRRGHGLAGVTGNAFAGPSGLEKNAWRDRARRGVSSDRSHRRPSISSPDRRRDAGTTCRAGAAGKSQPSPPLVSGLHHAPLLQSVTPGWLRGHADALRGERRHARCASSATGHPRVSEGAEQLLHVEDQHDLAVGQVVTPATPRPEVVEGLDHRILASGKAVDGEDEALSALCISTPYSGVWTWSQPSRVDRA